MSQKAPTSSTPSSIIRAALERLSFRSLRKKNIKYDLVIEKKENPDVDKSEIDFEVVTEERPVQNIFEKVTLALIVFFIPEIKRYIPEVNLQHLDI